MDNNAYDTFDFIAIFNTCLGLNNMELNHKQQQHQYELEEQLNRMENKLDILLEKNKEDKDVSK